MNGTPARNLDSDTLKEAKLSNAIASDDTCRTPPDANASSLSLMLPDAGISCSGSSHGPSEPKNETPASNNVNVMLKEAPLSNAIATDMKYTTLPDAKASSSSLMLP